MKFLFFAFPAFFCVFVGNIPALTARELGSRLGTSARPIFTVFRNMDEVKLAARELAMREFEEYAGDFAEYKPAFKRIGMLMVSYGVHEPELFKLLFMQEHREGQSFENTIRDLGEIAEICMELIQRDYGLEAEQAKLLFEQMWVHTFGLGALCAMKVCDLDEEEIARNLGEVFAGMVMIIKSGNLNNAAVRPIKEDEELPEKLPWMIRETEEMRTEMSAGAARDTE